MGKYLELQKEFEQSINKFSIENTSNTPDFILAKIAVRAIENFENASLERERWFGKSLRLGQSE